MPKQIREVYGSVLAELGETNENIVVLDADLSGSTKSAIFGKAHPERFFNMGIAEQNMVATGRRHGCLRQDPVREHLYGFPHLAGSALGSRPDMLRKPERQVRRRILRHVRRAGRRKPPCDRGYCFHARIAEYEGHRPCRRGCRALGDQIRR